MTKPLTFLDFIKAVAPPPARMPDMPRGDPNGAALAYREAIAGNTPAGTERINAAKDWLRGVEETTAAERAQLAELQAQDAQRRADATQTELGAGDYPQLRCYEL